MDFTNDIYSSKLVLCLYILLHVVFCTVFILHFCAVLTLNKDYFILLYFIKAYWLMSVLNTTLDKDYSIITYPCRD